MFFLLHWYYVYVHYYVFIYYEPLALVYKYIY